MPQVHKKRILITGASGYLAGRIFQSLKKFDLYDFVLGSRNISSASELDFYHGQEVRHFDIANPGTFANALHNVDVVLHLASMNLQDSQSNPQLAQNINVDMVQMLITESIKSHVKQFVYMSTFHVYGPTSQGIITEETPTNPISVYAKTHLEAEKLLLAEKRIQGQVIRLSNAIGAPLIKDISAWKLVANDLCKQACANKKIILNSTGDQKRDFFAVSCIGNAIHTLLSSNENRETSAIYNLGSERTISILEMAQLIQKCCKKNLAFTPSIERKIDPSITAATFPAFKYSCQKIRSLGFKVSTSLEEEIKNTLLTLV